MPAPLRWGYVVPALLRWGRASTATMSWPCPASARRRHLGRARRRSAAMAEHGICTVVGVASDDPAALPPDAVRALAAAHLVVGDRRHLALLERLNLPRAAVAAAEDDDDACRRAAAAVRQGRSVCLLASGDPGFFGILRSLLRVLDRRRLRVMPAPSPVSVAFARLGLPWDDAVVVATEGRPLDDVIRDLRPASKAAVLASALAPPERIGRALRRASATVDVAAVCSRLGTHQEEVTVVTLDALATGTFQPCSIVVLVGPAGRPLVGWGAASGAEPPLAWSLPDDAFFLEGTVVPDAEVRAVVLGKLRLPRAGVLWEVGGGSVAIEAASISPGLTTFAVEERGDRAAQLTAAARSWGAMVNVVHGHVPDACELLPDPDRAFVGTGGLVALDYVLERLRPGGVVVTSQADLEGAAAAAGRLGNLVQLAVNRGQRTAGGAWGIAADGPVFVAWGPGETS